MNNRWRRVKRLKKQEMRSEDQMLYVLAAEALLQHSKEIEKVWESHDEVVDPMTKDVAHPQSISIPEATPQLEKQVHHSGVFKRVASKIGSWFFRKRKGENNEKH